MDITGLKTAVTKTKAILATPYAAFFLAAVMGALFFIIFYGTKILDPTYTDWLLGGGDLKQHFIGWEFYRSDTWSFPLGAIHQLAYPFGISVTYMDSIPLFAIPAKLFAGIMPEHFQYFGWWGLLCYMLQGGIVALILRRWTNNLFVILAGSLVFLFAPIFTARMFSHTALAGHWIILLSIWAFLAREKFTTAKKHILVWSGIFALATTVHPYFLPMVALPFAMSLIVTHKRWLASIAKAMAPLLVAVLVFWTIGGFAVQADGSAAGLGDYGFNLNSLYNSLGWSGYLEALPNVSTSGETLNYLGMGMLLLVPVAIGCSIYRLRSVDRVKATVKRISLRHWLALLCILGLCILAISPRVQFGMTIIADIDLPGRIERVWSTFRASARLFWVVYYLIIFGLMAIVIRTLKNAPKWVLPALFAVIVSVQMVDIGRSVQATEKHQYFQQVDQGVTYNTKGLSKWSEFASGKLHMFYLEGMTNDDFFALSDIALRYNLTMNTGYFARAPYGKIEDLQRQQANDLYNGIVDDTMLYVTRSHQTAKLLKDRGRTVTSIDGYYVVN